MPLQFSFSFSFSSSSFSFSSSFYSFSSSSFYSFFSFFSFSFSFYRLLLLLLLLLLHTTSTTSPPPPPPLRCRPPRLQLMGCSHHPKSPSQSSAKRDFSQERPQGLKKKQQQRGMAWGRSWGAVAEGRSFSTNFVHSRRSGFSAVERYDSTSLA